MASRPVGPYSAAERRCYQPLHARSPPTATRSCRYNSSAPGYGQLRHDARFHWVVTKTVPGNDERIKSVVRPVSIGRLARCVVSNDIAEHRSEPDVSLHHVLRSAAPYLCFTQVYTSVVVNSAFVSIRIAYTSFARVCNAFRPRRRRTYVPDSGLRTRPTDTKRYDTPDGQPHYIYIYIYIPHATCTYHVACASQTSAMPLTAAANRRQRGTPKSSVSSAVNDVEKMKHDLSLGVLAACRLPTECCGPEYGDHGCE